MSDKVSGIMASATSVLKRAVELDTARKFTEAVVCYQEGLQLLMDVLKGSTNAAQKEAIRTKMKEYMGRAEQLKVQVEEMKEEGKYHEQIRIEANSTGHTYQSMFGRFMDDSVTEVAIEDPYIKNNHQIFNLLRFCELVVKSCPNVKTIRLVTGMEDNESNQQQRQQKLFQLSSSLQKYNITLEVSYSSTLHDREIRLDSGWIIKIGRGLDIYKGVDNKFSIGFCDFELRPCHETTVDIFHSKHVNTSGSSASGS